MGPLRLAGEQGGCFLRGSRAPECPCRASSHTQCFRGFGAGGLEEQLVPPRSPCHSTAPAAGVRELSGRLCPEETRWGVALSGPGAPQGEMRIGPASGSLCLVQALASARWSQNVPGGAEAARGASSLTSQGFRSTVPFKALATTRPPAQLVRGIAGLSEPPAWQASLPTCRLEPEAPGAASPLCGVGRLPLGRPGTCGGRRRCFRGPRGRGRAAPRKAPRSPPSLLPVLCCRSPTSGWPSATGSPTPRT